MRYKRLQVPWGEQTPDAKGFFEYAKEHYRDCLTLAYKTVYSKNYSGALHEKAFLAIFDKLASPLVYLYEAWEAMPPEKKRKYIPELAKIGKEAEALAEKAFSKKV